MKTQSEFQICFTLDPIDEIEPWGEGADRKLHWFGLSCGHYWISTPVGEVLRYTEANRKRWGSASPYVDYQVARIFEDIQEILAGVLEPVPSDIVEVVADENWYERSYKWMQLNANTDEQWDLWYKATEWLYDRSLDTGYLSNGPRIHLWRVGDEIFIDWMTKDTLKQDLWTCPEGQIQLSAKDFSETVNAFLDQVLSAMAARIATIEKEGWHRKDCKLDILLLVQDHQQRIDNLERQRTRQVRTDWSQIRLLLEKLSTCF